MEVLQVIMNLSVSVTGRNNNPLANSVKTAWMLEQQKMVETGFSQDQIDAYSEYSYGSS